MESTSAVSGLPSFKDLRSGQHRVVNLFRERSAVVAQLPTGYGKTLTAACSYLTLRSRGVVNRMLVIVPSSAQARQAGDDIPADLLKFGGIKTMAYDVGRTPIPALNANRKGTCEVFVATIQALVASTAAIDAIASMMEVGRWFVVVDEHHHYGSDSEAVWGSRVKSLPSTALLAMSATPHRRDGVSAFG
jgi:superfamily II DNA or RNA helicase